MVVALDIVFLADELSLITVIGPSLETMIAARLTAMIEHLLIAMIAARLTAIVDTPLCAIAFAAVWSDLMMQV